MGRRTGFAEVAREGRRGLACSCTAEHTLEDGQTVVVGDDLLQADGGDVQFGAGGRHVGVALIGAYHDVARLGYSEVAACHTCVCCQELVPQTQSCHVGQIGGIVVALLTAQFLFEEFAHVVVVQVDGGHHDMAGLLTFQLDDAFAKVCLYHFDAVLLQIGVHLALLRQH